MFSKGVMFPFTVNSRYENSVPAFLPGSKARLGHNKIRERISGGGGGSKIRTTDAEWGAAGGSFRGYSRIYAHTCACARTEKALNNS